MAIGKWAKKKSAQATKAAGKRYGISYGRKGLKFKKNTMSKLAKDVMMIKASLNTEKKFKDTLEASTGNVGQVRDNADGYAGYTLTPSITQGAGEGQRVGNSIKATGLVLKLNMIKQNQAEGSRAVCIRIVRVTDPGLSPTQVHSKLLDLNPFVPVRDYNSNLDYTELKDGRIRVIATKKVFFPQNGGDGMNLVNEAMTRSITVPVKLNDVLRYDANTDSTPENVNYMVIITADNGNCGTTTSTLLGVTVPGSESGLDFKMHSRFWYVDN